MTDLKILISVMLCGFFLILSSVVELMAQDPIVIQRIGGPVELDGLSNESAWDSIRPMPMVMHLPDFGGPPTERTEIRVAYDDDYVYVAGRFYDSQPELIQTTSLRRDKSGPTNDQFGLVLDTFNDKENGLFLYTNSVGVRLDAAIRNDATGSPPFFTSWNTFWDAAGTQNEEGWFAEMRIPFSSLRFQDDNGKVTMGLLLYRWIARKYEVVVFPEIPPKWGFHSLVKPSQGREIVFEGIRSSKPFYVTPYGLTGVEQSYSLNPQNTGYQSNKQSTREIGLDLKYGLANNFTLDLTLNTDFAQVEADDQQVNLTRFSLFFPEKRLFFQERASIFDFRTGGKDNLFYSRRIGINNGGVVPIYGGARVVGRVGDWDVGFLNMQTRSNGTAESPSENFGVLRMRRRVLNDNSYIGGIATTRLTAGGHHLHNLKNVAYGLDGVIRLFNDDYLTFNWAQSLDGRHNNRGLNSALTRAHWERRTVEGFGYELSATRVGSAYDPGVGYVQRTGFTRIGDRIFKGWTAPSESSTLRHLLSMNGYLFLRNEDRSLESAEIGPEWKIDAKSGAVLTLTAKAIYEDLPYSFKLSESAHVPVGSYSFHDLSASYRLPISNMVRLTAKGSAGSFYDGSRLSLSLSPGWSISKHLEFTGNYQYERIRFPDRAENFDSHIARLRVETALTPKLSAIAFIQYNSAVDRVISNFRIRFNPKEGSDLYIVYNELLNTERYRHMPIMPLRDNRTLLIKYSYTFTLGG